MDIRLQWKLPHFEPAGLTADIDLNRKINIHSPLVGGNRLLRVARHKVQTVLR